MRRQAGSCRRNGESSCSLRRRQTKRWICWTKPQQPLRRAWSGKPSGEGLSSMDQRLLGIAGIIVILGIAFVLSTNRKAIRLRVVAAAFALQAGIALVVLKTAWGVAAIQGMSYGVSNLLGYAREGTMFLFGELAVQYGD